MKITVKHEGSTVEIEDPSENTWGKVASGVIVKQAVEAIKELQGEKQNESDDKQ